MFYARTMNRSGRRGLRRLGQTGKEGGGRDRGFLFPNAFWRVLHEDVRFPPRLAGD